LYKLLLKYIAKRGAIWDFASMIRRCQSSDLPGMCAVINEAASVYKGVIPSDRWHEPYMPLEELREEIRRGVEFWGYEENGQLAGVMGLQRVKDVILIRHAYVKPEMQNRGIGGNLMRHLLERVDGKTLVGTWKAASWAIRFYEKYGFQLVGNTAKNQLLTMYWQIPRRQIETSVVLAYRGVSP
jgi:N-acetylglutamate synthase-like GNAT family acetyltransferase